MDVDRFDHLVRTLTQASTRRSVLGLLAALGLTGLVARDVAAQECAVNGTRCGRTDDPDCCSGRCVRKRGTNKKFCRRAPGQGICTIASDTCAGTDSTCDDSSSAPCLCWVTSRGYSFCGRNSRFCFNCETDADCEQEPLVGEAGARCVQCTLCGTATNNRACVRKCPNPA